MLSERLGGRCKAGSGGNAGLVGVGFEQVQVFLLDVSEVFGAPFGAMSSLI